MIKIPTLFKKDPTDLGRVINELQCEWVYDSGVRATRKFDGTAAAIIDGKLYKRYDVKRGRHVPEGAMPCQEPDAITGHWPHWVAVTKEDKWFMEGLHNSNVNGLTLLDGTYELCGPKVQGNPEKLPFHMLIKHGSESVTLDDLDFDTIKDYLSTHDVEGIVFHHPDGRMCKIRKSDFGIKR